MLHIYASYNKFYSGIFDKKDLTCHKFNIQHKKSIEIGEA